ncbi:hypothetical protein D3C72_1756160 [compost metagenome]
MLGHPCQGFLDDPAVYARGQVVALHGGHEFTRRHQPAVGHAHAQQDLAVQPGARAARRRAQARDGLAKQLKPVVLQRMLDPADPFHHAVALRQGGVVVGVDVDAVAAAVLGHVAGAVGSLQQGAHAFGGGIEHHCTNAHTHAEHVLAPHKPEGSQPLLHAVGQLQGLRQVVLPQQDAELVSPQAA